MYELNKKVYDNLDKDVLIDLKAETDMQDRFDQMLYDLNIDYKTEYAKTGKTQNLYYSTVPESYVKKTSRRMSVQLREYSKAKYKSNWQHSGVHKK